MESVIRQLLEKKNYDVNDLVTIVRVLRSENGCPWDKVQTHKTIRKDLIEETYEVIEAIDCDSPEMMQEELGWSGYGDPDYPQHVLRYYH